MHWQTWAVGSATFGLLLIANVICDPGVGFKGPPQSPEVELERYFGWPAWYRVELWESRDPAINDMPLGEFRWLNPEEKMTLRKRHVHWKPIAVNLIFTLAAVVLLGTLSEGESRGELRLLGIGLVVFSTCSLFGMYMLADVVEVHL